MFNSKKAIGPVIASALFLVVAVVSVISFQTWFADYGSQIFTNVESRSAESVSNTKIEAILGETLYFKNGFNSNLSITDIKVDGNSCSVITNVSNGIAAISLGNNCTNNLTTSTPEVVVYTQSGIYSAYVWYKNATITASESLESGNVTNESTPIASYSVGNSLKFNDDDSAYLSRTPSVIGNRTTWTWSGWVKRSYIASGTSDNQDVAAKTLFTGYNAYTRLAFSDRNLGATGTNNDRLAFTFGDGSYSGRIRTKEVFSDPSDWYHIVAVADTTNPTANDRLQLYVNGKRVTVFDTESYPAVTSTGEINTAQLHYMGKESTYYYDGYMSNIYFIDGQALNASYFGQFNSAGKWISKQVNVSDYGSNGFYLPFNQSTNLGRDFSGNNNDWILNNIDEGQGLLIHSNNSNGDTNFVDSSGRSHSITKYGNVAHNTTTSKFGNSAIYFDGAGDYLSISSIDDFNYPLGTDFTVDAWLNFEADSGDNGLFVAHTASTTNGWQIYYTAGLLHLWNQGSDRTIAWTPTFGTWYHLAIVRSGTTITAYINGNNIGTFVDGDTSDDGVDNLYIGTINSGGAGNFQGYMDEIRITKGKALWTSNFTVPNAPASVLDAPSTDQMIDTPTNNFAIINSLSHDNSATSNLVLSNGNLKIVASNDGAFASSLGVDSGKWYWEVNSVSRPSWSQMIGVIASPEKVSTATAFAMTASRDTFGYNGYNGNKYDSEVTYAYDAGTWGTGDTVSIALDLDNNAIWFAKNGVWQISATQSEIETGTTTNAAFSGSLIQGEKYFPLNYLNDGIVEYNFGQGGQSGLQYCSNTTGYFKYCPPNGFKALSTKNLPSPAINISKQFFDTLLYVGTGSSAQNISGLSFQPDFSWIKSRSGAFDHNIFDYIRGTENRLFSDQSWAAQATTGGFTSFNLDGFSIGTGNYGDINNNADTYVAWNWKESPIAGFDIVNYTGDGTSFQAVSHNLNTNPDFMIIKDRDNGDPSWHIYHKDSNAVPEQYYFQWPSTGGPYGPATTLFANTKPNSTHFFLGTGGVTPGDSNYLNVNYIAYIFSERDGFSKFGKYKGNSLADGPFIYTGFKPAYIMIKDMGQSSNWHIWDSKRNPINPAGTRLNTEAVNIENVDTTNYPLDLVSNGFKVRSASGTDYNGPREYMYIAFAEYPFR